MTVVKRPDHDGRELPAGTLFCEGMFCVLNLLAELGNDVDVCDTKHQEERGDACKVLPDVGQLFGGLGLDQREGP